MKLLTIALMTILLLNGCKAVHTSTAGLTVIEYTKATQQAAAKEMKARACPALNGFMNDYLVLRDQARIK